MKRAFVAVAALALLSIPSLAVEKKHPEIIANKGIAFSLLDDKTGVVTAYDTVAAYEYQTAISDCARFSANYKGVKWCFSSAENLSKFEKQLATKFADKYVPYYGGRCSQGASNGNLDARGDPRTAVRIKFSNREQDERVFLNGSMDVRTSFLGHTSEAIAAGRQTMRAADWMGLIVPNEQFSQ